MCGALLLAALVLLLFGDLLLPGGQRILSHLGADTWSFDTPWREFDFSEMRRGHLPYWNPYILCGTPSFTQGQIGILYPANWLQCFLPIPLATNLVFVIHVFLVGFWTFLLLLRRGQSFPASLLGGTLLMCCAQFQMHIYAGHIDGVIALSWEPFLLIAADVVLARKYLAGILLGACGLTMQLLAYQPQYTYYTLITISLYMLVHLVWRQPNSARARAVLTMVAIGALGVAVTSVQVIPTLLQVSESSRGGAGVSIAFGGMFSFPPENILTLVAPDFFGDPGTGTYWGRCYLWEMSAFLGVAGTVLAICGVVWVRDRRRIALVIVVLVLCVLALGQHTPAFEPMFRYFPGFSRFRGTSKFAFHAMIFVVMLAAMGLDALLAGGKDTRALAAALATAGAGFAGVGLLCGRWIGGWVGWVQRTGESYLTPQTVGGHEFIEAARRMATGSLLTAAALMGLAALLLAAVRWFPRAAYFLGALGAVEVAVFVAGHRASFSASELTTPGVQTALAGSLGDGRVLMLPNPNQAMLMRVPAIWGYSSFFLNRYLEFVAAAQGRDPDNFAAKTYPAFAPNRLSTLFAMLRLEYIVYPAGNDIRISKVQGPIARLPHLALIGNWVQIADRDAIFKRMNGGKFDPNKTVILETEPQPRPTLDVETQPDTTAGAPGTAWLVRERPDSLEIKADLSRAAILLITDAYAKGWHAIPLAGSSQPQYQLLPGDYTLRAIPLGAGYHHLLVEFSPGGLAAGWAVTALGIVTYLLLLGIYLWRRRAPADAPATTVPRVQ